MGWFLIDPFIYLFLIRKPPFQEACALLSTLNNSIYNSKARKVPVSIGLDIRGNRIISSAACDIEDIIY